MEKLSGSVLCIFVLLHLYVLNMLCIVCLVSAFIAIFSIHLTAVSSAECSLCRPPWWSLLTGNLFIIYMSNYQGHHTSTLVWGCQALLCRFAAQRPWPLTSMEMIQCTLCPTRKFKTRLWDRRIKWLIDHCSWLPGIFNDWSTVYRLRH